jgi:hypothetical protein
MLLAAKGAIFICVSDSGPSAHLPLDGGCSVLYHAVTIAPCVETVALLSSFPIELLYENGPVNRPFLKQFPGRFLRVPAYVKWGGDDFYKGQP